MAPPPINLDNVPNDLADQGLIGAILGQDAYNELAIRQRYNDTLVKCIPLSKYRTIFKSKNIHHALGLMRCQTEIEVDD
jgi:hypothetical protein